MGMNVQSGTDSMTTEGKDFNFSIAGFQFIPLEKELCDFLKQKILGLQYPAQAIEELDDIYSYHPEELPMDKFGKWRKNEAFFFTHKYSESLNSKKVRDGYWKALGGDVEILDWRTKTVVGFKRMVFFCWEPELVGMEINWFIHEYRITTSTCSVYNDDKELIAKMERYVLCKVQAKAGKAEKIPKLLEYAALFDRDEPGSDSEEEHFGSDDSSDDPVNVIAESERGERYKPALAFQDDEVDLEELFPKFIKHESSPSP